MSMKSHNPQVQETRIKTLVRAGRHQLIPVKANLITKLPKLTATEVRRHRIQHWQSVIIELEEEGFEDAAKYMTMLFELDQRMRIEAGPGSVVWNKPMLKQHGDYLERLRRGLTDAEIAKTSGELLTNAQLILDLALFFQRTSWEWFWIADQLFRTSLEMANNIQRDKTRMVNVIRYLYGRFLFNQMNYREEAVAHLEKVRVASRDQVWNASKILGINQETVYRECCAILHKALIADAVDAADAADAATTKQDSTEHMEMSVRAAVQALEQATHSLRDDYKAAALCQLGKSQLSMGDIRSALASFSKFLAMAKRIPDPEATCNAHMELAFAYQHLEDTDGTVKHLGLFRKSATLYKLPYKLAQAHYYTGEYLLNKNEPNLATPHLHLALSQLDSLGRRAEANRARCAAAISKGQEVMDRYIDLILACQGRVTGPTTKICLWKTNRLPFWTSTSPSLTRVDDNDRNSRDPEHR